MYVNFLFSQLNLTISCPELALNQSICHHRISIDFNGGQKDWLFNYDRNFKTKHFKKKLKYHYENHAASTKFKPENRL